MQFKDLDYPLLPNWDSFRQALLCAEVLIEVFLARDGEIHKKIFGAQVAQLLKLQKWHPKKMPVRCWWKKNTTFMESRIAYLKPLIRKVKGLNSGGNSYER